MNPLFSVQELSTSLSPEGETFQVVDRLSFTLNLGETLALVGESGSGKTLAALSLLKLIPPDLHPTITGQVLLNGTDLLQLSHRALREVRGKEVGFIFQNPKRALNPVFSIGEQLREVLHYRTTLSEEAIEVEIIEALRRVGIPSPEEHLSSYPHQFSGGMIQRVMIAGALLLKPKLLIADEPTTALDVTTQAEILKLLKKLQAEEGMALLLITHDMGVVAEMADKVLVLYASQEVESASTEKLFRKPLHPYTKALFQARFEGKKLPYPIPGAVPSPQHFPSGCHFAPRCSKRFSPCGKEVPSFAVDGQKVRCWLYEGDVSC